MAIRPCPYFFCRNLLGESISAAVPHVECGIKNEQFKVGARETEPPSIPDPACRNMSPTPDSNAKRRPSEDAWRVHRSRPKFLQSCRLGSET
jgi:hypothetical protein